jgi:signal transduction histidine kinase
VAKDDNDGGSTQPLLGSATSTQSKGVRTLFAGWQRARMLGLSGKLLVLTGIFIMLAEVLIFVPSIANYRVNWLSDRINAAHLAALASDAVPGGVVPAMIKAELLSTAQVKGVAIKRMSQRRMVLPPDEEVSIDGTYDVRPMPLGFTAEVGRRFELIADALAVFFMPADRTIRVLGHPAAPRKGEVTAFPYAADDFVEIILPEAPLRAAMIGFGLNILALSIIISLIAATLVYWALRGLLVSPMMRLAENMTHFGAMPEDASRIIVPSAREDEIGVAERELAKMQTQLVHLLQQRSRLAQLGLAVAKVNHDLRNMLTTAQLMSDRLAALPDPAVQRFSPKLIASLDRAIAFCNETLQFGKAEENTPHRTAVALRSLAQDVGEGLALPREAIDLQIDIDTSLRVSADPDYLFRILNNLARNAVQALESANVLGGQIIVRARHEGRGVVVEVADNGPGVPERALGNLFKAFTGGTRKGGTGLGLAIAAELVAAHGGQLVYKPGTPGAIFVFDIPDREG